MSFKQFEKNIQSQFGEDGVIEEIFNRIGIQNNICVEFGAWDGIHLSNTWNLWHNNSWAALLIEGDSIKFDTLVKNTSNFNKVKSLNTYVTTNGENSLDSIFSKIHFPLDIDLLSIDIDSDDFYIFESLNNYRPRLVIVEYNPTIPPYLDIVQKPGEYFGCSALSLYNLGKLKDYKVVHMTDTNMFFVRSEDFNKLNLDEPELHHLFPVQYLTNVLTSYDGDAFLTRVPIYMKQLENEKSKSTKAFSTPKKRILKIVKPTSIDLIPVSILKKNIETE